MSTCRYVAIRVHSGAIFTHTASCSLGQLRRWLVMQKAKLFQLSPAELDMITREVKAPEPAVTT